jgi:hypothetical protein
MSAACLVLPEVLGSDPEKYPEFQGFVPPKEEEKPAEKAPEKSEAEILKITAEFELEFRANNPEPIITDSDNQMQQITRKQWEAAKNKGLKQLVRLDRE